MASTATLVLVIVLGAPQNQGYVPVCSQWLGQTYGAQAVQMYSGIVSQGGDPWANCGAVAEFMDLRKMESQRPSVPAVLAITYWNLRTGNTEQRQPWSREAAYAEAHRIWDGTTIQQIIGNGPAEIFNHFSPSGATLESSHDAYYKVFAYTNGWDKGYEAGVRLHGYLRAGGRENDANAAAIQQAGRQQVDMLLQQTPWSQRISGAVWQGFSDGLAAGTAEGYPNLRKPQAADVNRALPPACRNRDRRTPGWDDLKCTQINYGPGILGR